MFDPDDCADLLSTPVPLRNTHKNNSRSSSLTSNESRSIMSSHNLSAILVEAIFLSTEITPDQIFTRPIFTSQTATSCSIIPPIGVDDFDSLHFFQGAEHTLQICFRIVGREGGDNCSLWVHLSLLLNEESTVELSVCQVSPIPTESAESGTGRLVSFPSMDILPESTLRVQVFDQYKKLVFCHEWHSEVGILNEDAVEWLKESHFTCPLFESFPSQEISINNNSTPQIYYSLPQESSVNSISDSFVEFDLESPRHLSRSDSVITLSPSRIRSNTGVETVDLLHQMGFWLYGSRVGQIMKNRIDSKSNAKTLFSPSPIWLLGNQFQNDEIAHQNTHSMIYVGQLLRIASFDLDHIPDPIHFDQEEFLICGTFRISGTSKYCLREYIINFLHDDGWTSDTNVLSHVIKATKENIKMSLEISLEYSNLKMSGKNSTIVRTFFVDFISQLLAIYSLHIIEDVTFDTRSISISGHESVKDAAKEDFGTMFRVTPSISTPFVEIRSITVLLWSENAFGWIERQIKLDNTILTIESKRNTVDPLKIEISSSEVYAFKKDNSRVLVHSSGSWLCFQSRNINLLTWFQQALSKQCVNQENKAQLEYKGPIESSKRVTSWRRSSTYSSRSPNHKKPPGMKEFWEKFDTCFLFTYRKDFSRLAPSILSSDAGFGCMVRAGQCIIAEALALLYLGSNRNMDRILSNPSAFSFYKIIVSLFLDDNEYATTFGALNLIRKGAEFGIPIGERFTPSVLAKVLQSRCYTRPDLPFDILYYPDGTLPLTTLKRKCHKRPHVVLLTFRLGAEHFNPEYLPLLKSCLSSRLTLGIIGGREARAFYIIGFQDDSLLYIDPHSLKPALLSEDQAIANRDVHPTTLCELSWPQLDPNILFAFLCRNENEATELVKMLTTVPLSMPLFSIVHDS